MCFQGGYSLLLLHWEKRLPSQNYGKIGAFVGSRRGPMIVTSNIRDFSINRILFQVFLVLVPLNQELGQCFVRMSVLVVDYQL